MEDVLLTPSETPDGKALKTDPEAVKLALESLARETAESARRVSQEVTPGRATYVEF